MEQEQKRTSRNVAFRRAFEQHMYELKAKYGYGRYSWAEGATRKSMRRVARKLARKDVANRW